MIRRIDISIGLLAAGFLFVFLGSTFGFFLASYVSGVCFIISLALYVNITPIIALGVIVFGIFLSLISPSPYLLAALFPLFGLFFSGTIKYSINSSSKSRYTLLIVICIIYLMYVVGASESSVGSHNQLSVFVTFAIIAEIFYFGKPSRFYILLILISVFIFGNRSSFFLLATFLKNKISLISFLLVSLIMVLITYGDMFAPDFLKFLFQDGGLFYRTYEEARTIYFGEFIDNFDFLNLKYNAWNFFVVPKTESGFYDLHNSFLTIIVRDSYLGIFKVCLWIISAYYIPLPAFVAISLRAFHDSFLLGGIIDVVLYALIGRSLVKIYFDMILSYGSIFRVKKNNLKINN